MARAALPVISAGWIGREDGELYFRPTRGSDGWAIYETKEAALRFTGCPDAIRVRIEIHIEEGT